MIHRPGVPRWVQDPRSWGLQFAAGACLSRALAYFPQVRQGEELPVGLADVARVVPTWVYGLVWAVTAAAISTIAVVGARPSARMAGLLVAVPCLWGALYIVGGFTDQGRKAFTGGYLFVCLAGIIVTFLIVQRRDGLWDRTDRR